MNKYSTAFVLIFVALVHGHGWLNSPQPGGFAGVKNQAGASQSSPCGLGVDPEIPPTIVTNYGELNISYTIGGGHDGSTPSSCRFSIARQMNNTQFEQNVVYTISPCTEGEFNKTITASFPDLTAPETFYFQFFWQAGDGGKWYGCARVGLNPASVVINDFSVGTPVTGNIDGPETIYYKTTASTSKNVYVKAFGAERGDVMVYGKSGSAASTSSYDFTANLTAGESVGFSLCGSPTVDQDVYINYVGADNNTSGDFSFVTSEYTSEIIFSNPTPQISDSISGPGSKFYYTAAYTTSEKPKIVVVSTQGTVSVKQTIGVTCTTSRTFDATGSGNVCFKLSDNKNTKTIQVYSMGTASYTVSVQNGDCAELEQGSNSFRIQFSVALLVVSVILSLFL